jgi:hypothetical protein
VPDGWPDSIQCPGCGVRQPTSAYLQLTKPHNQADDFNLVLVCLRNGCTNIFSPKPERFASIEQEQC